MFDCDGVLVASERTGLRSLQQALEEVGLDIPLVELYRFSGCSHGETLSCLSREYGGRWDKGIIAERMDEIYKEIVAAEGLSSCPGILQLLNALMKAAIPFTLGSSGPRSKVSFSLKSAGLDSYFPRFICGDDVSRAKPAPDIYLAAADLLGLQPSQCLALEDAPNGIRAALDAGMQTVGVPHTYPAKELRQAHCVIDSINELLCAVFPSSQRQDALF